MRETYRLVIISAVLALPALTARPLSAQDPQADPARQEPKPATAAPETIPWLDLSIEHRTRYESLSNRFRLGTSGCDEEIAQRTRLRLGLSRIIDPFGLFLEFEDARAHLDNSSPSISNNRVDENDILQLYLSLTIKRPAGSNLASMLYFGRQSFDLGSRRLFARNRFRNATNSFDGIRWTLGDNNRWTVDAFIFQPVQRRMRSLDPWFHGGYLWGAFVSDNRSPRFKREIYYFGIRESERSAQSQKRRFATIGARLYKDPSAGSVSYDLETAWQLGKVGTLDHLAYLLHLQTDYTFDARWRPRISGRFIYASGDRDPKDNRDGTFDPLYGSRTWEYGPTGIYGPWYRSNLISPGWAVELNPAPGFVVTHSMRWIWLAQARDQWPGTGLRDVTGKSGTYIGSQFEMILRYNRNRHFQPAIGYLRLIKGSYLEHVPKSPGAKDSNYFFVEANFFFNHLLR